MASRRGSMGCLHPVRPPHFGLSEVWPWFLHLISVFSHNHDLFQNVPSGLQWGLGLTPPLLGIGQLPPWPEQGCDRLPVHGWWRLPICAWKATPFLYSRLFAAEDHGLGIQAVIFFVVSRMIEGKREMGMKEERNEIGNFFFCSGCPNPIVWASPCFHYRPGRGIDKKKKYLT